MLKHRGFPGRMPGTDFQFTIRRANGQSQTITVLCRIDTAQEVDYYRNGGVLHYVLRNLNRKAA